MELIEQIARVLAKTRGLAADTWWRTFLAEAGALLEAIRPIIDERDALRAENEALASNLRGKHAITGATYAHLIEDRDALRAEIGAVKKQEPVAWTTKLALHIGKDVLGFQVSAVNMWGEKGVALYLAPGVQPAAAPKGRPTDA